MDKSPLIRPASPNPHRAETLELFRDLLGRGLNIRLRVTGRSMSPSIVDGDMVVLQPPGRLYRGSVVFVVNEFGTPVLHRIIGLRSDRIRTMGDALNAPDRWVPKDSVLATATVLERETPEGAKRTIRFAKVPGLMMAARSYLRALACRLCRPGLEAVRALLRRKEENGA